MSAEVDIEAKAWPIAVASSLATQPVMIRASSALKDTEGRLSCSPADHSSFRSRSADGFRATDNETVWESYLGLLVSGKVLIIELPFCVATISTLVRAYVSLCEFCSVCSDRRPPPSGTGWHYTWGGANAGRPEAEVTSPLRSWSSTLVFSRPEVRVSQSSLAITGAYI